jgi:hypothetical protein
MTGRPEQRPGEFKHEPNRVGAYRFVDPELVAGTLTRASPLLDVPGTALGRGVLAMVIVSEVHPFADGNGRLARVFLNAPLSAAGLSRIIVPTVWRTEYLDGLRRLSREGNVALLLRVLEHAWRWTGGMPWHTDHTMVRAELERTNALATPDEALTEGLRLELPVGIRGLL